MKRILFAVLAVGLLTAPASADYFVAGEFNSWWNPGDPNYQMNETFPGSNIWTKTLSGEGVGRHEFKITDGTWGWNHPGPNSWLFTDGGGGVTITFDNNTYADGWSPTWGRLGLSTDPGSWNAVGDFLSELGGSDWWNADPVGAMTLVSGGIYKLQATLPPGTYNWKAVVTGSWDAISWDNRSVNSSNWEFTVDATNNTAVMWVNAYAGTAKIDIIPEPATLALLLIGGLALVRRRG